MWQPLGMTLSELIDQHGGQAAFARLVGMDRHYLNRVVKNHRPLGAAAAVQIFNVTGHRFGPLAADQTERAA